MRFFVCIQQTTRIREDQSFFDRLIECDIQEPVITVNREVAFEVGMFTQVSDETFHESGIFVFMNQSGSPALCTATTYPISGSGS